MLLSFWSFFCAPGREEMPMISGMARQHCGKGLQVLGGNLDGVEISKAINKFVENEKIALRIVFDELADKKGNIAIANPGAVTGEELTRQIEKTLRCARTARAGLGQTGSPRSR